MIITLKEFEMKKILLFCYVSLLMPTAYGVGKEWDTVKAWTIGIGCGVTEFFAGKILQPPHEHSSKIYGAVNLGSMLGNSAGVYYSVNELRPYHIVYASVGRVIGLYCTSSALQAKEGKFERVNGWDIASGVMAVSLIWCVNTMQQTAYQNNMKAILAEMQRETLVQKSEHVQDVPTVK